MEVQFISFFVSAILSITNAIPAGMAGPIPGGVNSLSPTDPMATKTANFIAQKIKSRRNMREMPNIIQIGPVDQQVVAGLLVSFRNLTLGSGAKIEDCAATVWSQPWSNEEAKLTKLFCVTRPTEAGFQGGPPMAGGLSDTLVTEVETKKALDFAEAELNKRRNSPFLWQIVSVNKAKSQVVSGSMFHFEVEFAPTSCLKSLPAGLQGGCFPSEAKHELCKGVKVWSQPWMQPPVKLVEDDMKCGPADNVALPPFMIKSEAECLASAASDPCATASWDSFTNTCAVAMPMCVCPPPLVIRNTPGKCCDCGPADINALPPTHQPQNEAECLAKHASDPCAHASWIEESKKCLVAMDMCHCLPPKVLRNTPGKCCDCGYPIPLLGANNGGSGFGGSGNFGSGNFGMNGGGFGVGSSGSGNPLEAKTEADCMALRRQNPCYRPSWMPFPAPGRCAVAVMSCVCKPGTKPAPSNDVCCNCVPDTTTMTTPFPMIMDKCVGTSCICPPGMTGVEPFCTPIEKPVIMDRCEGASCICPPGMTGVQPFCRLIEPEIVGICPPGMTGTPPFCKDIPITGNTPCERQRSESERMSVMGMVGQMTPKCDADGTFSELQCHGSIGFCWCALVDGTEVDGTRFSVRSPGYTKPDCSVHRLPPVLPVLGATNNNNNNANSKCSMDKVDADRRSAAGIIGHFTPSCDADGSFSAEQCHGSTGQCWCVKEDGSEVMGTRLNPGELAVVRRDCRLNRNNNVGGNNNNNNNNNNINNECPKICTMDYRPVCDSNGNTHGNRCAFEIAACEAKKMGLTLTMTYPTACQEICNQMCTMEYMPVCDSNGVTHGNKCTFESAACEARKKELNIFIAKQGPCQDAAGGIDGGVIMDKCEGDSCKCPPGLVGVQPFCRQPDVTAPTVAVPTREKCLDGTSKKVDCNTCSCMNGMWACTLMACFNNNNNNNINTLPMPTTAQPRPDECSGDGCQCPPGMIGVQPFCRPQEPRSTETCNQMCTMEYMPVCDSNGVTHGNKCTFESAACEARKKELNIFIAKQGPCQDEPVCRDGESKKMDCNDCRCMRGLWACTRKFCLPTTSAPNTPCPPGMRGFQPYCRPALPKPDILATGICATSPQLPCCNATIKVYDVLNGPFEIADLGFPSCKPDGYYSPRQCGMGGCYCVKPNGDRVETNGQPGFSFDIQCPDFASVTSECTNGEVKEKDCNTCRCSNGRWACTKKLCFTPNGNFECSNGETEKQYCNTCVCSNGRWACTEKLCLGGTGVRATECNNGETKKQDCNSCRCSNGIWACTMMLCGEGTETRNTMSGSGYETGAGSGSLASSGEACLNACASAHNPWKEIGETPAKALAWNCVDKCKDVTCNRKCEIVYPNRGEELTVMKCKTKKCAKTREDLPAGPSSGSLNKNYGVKGGLRSFVTRKPSANYGIKS